MPACQVSCTALQEVTWRDGAGCPYDEELAVFRFQLPSLAGIPPYLKGLLQPDEVRRAKRYYREEDRQQFMYTRSLLRLLSGNYTNQSPQQIQFTMGRYKKPELSGDTGWHINVSHSGDWVLLAIGRVNVGVDVEKINPQFSFEDVLANSFSPEEQAYISGPADRGSFYELWTRKEALLKATGKGMDDDFRQIPSLNGQHVTDSSLIGETGDWMVKSFVVTPDHPAAVAYRAMSELPKFYTLESGRWSY